jgi:aminopeptidase N
MSCGQYVALAIGGLPAETDIGVVQKVLMQVRTAIDAYAAPANRARYRVMFAAAVERATLAAAPGSDHQLAYVRSLAGLAQTTEQLDLLAGLLSGTRSIEGLLVDTELRWTLLHRLVQVGRAGEPEIAAELDRDNTATGLRHATAARASRPTEQAKEAAWHAAVSETTLPNALVEANISGLLIAEQSELLRPYRERYFEVAPQVWSTRSSEMAGMVATFLYPSLLIEDETVVASERFLSRADLAAGLRRIVTEGRDGVERALRCRVRDAAEPSS